MDARIILAGQPVNALASLGQGMALGQQRQEWQRQNALANYVQANGAGIMAGDPTALGGYAAFDPQAALGIQSARQAMTLAEAANQRAVTDLGWRTEDRAREARERLTADQQGQLDAGMRELAVLYASGNRTAFDAARQANGVADEHLTWDTFPAVAARLSPTAYALLPAAAAPSGSWVDGTYYEDPTVRGQAPTPLLTAPGATQTMTGAQVEAQFPGVRVPDASALYVIKDGAPTLVDGTGGGQTSYIATGEAAAALGLDPAARYNVTSGPEGLSAAAIGGSGDTTNVTVNGQPAPEIGVIPQGYEVYFDDNGQRRMRSIPGGPEDTSAQAAATANSQETTSDVVLSAALRAQAAAQSRGLGGRLGQVSGAMFAGSDNAELTRQVAVLKSTATIETLNAMRQQSPTGGALGNVTEGEGTMLAAKVGTLDPASPNFERDLADYTRTLLRIIHGSDAGDRIFAEQYLGAANPNGFAPASGAPAAPAPPPSDAVPPSTTDMSDEDLLRFYGSP